MISIVVTTRNDDHGGNMMHRLGRFVAALNTYRERHDWQMELILVEWNPPVDRPLLWQLFGPPPWMRVIQVPRSVHAQFDNSDLIRMFYCIGQNVGARCARGDWILGTGQDVIFSEQLVGFLFDEEQLDRSKVYRAYRTDIRSHEVPGSGLEEWLDFCRKDAYVEHSFRWEPALTNAAGDFHLMHRDAWYATRGYPEWHLQCVHLDGLFLNMCIAGGLDEFVVPGTIYHINHGGCLVSDPGYIDGMPKMDHWLDYYPIVMGLKAKRGLIRANDENWGLALSDMVEISPRVHRLESVVIPRTSLEKYKELVCR